jgi:hypothetical protein
MILVQIGIGVVLGVAWQILSWYIPPLDLRPPTRAELARLPFQPRGGVQEAQERPRKRQVWNRVEKMLTRSYGRIQHALWGSRKVDPVDARGLTAKRARRTQRRRERQQIRNWEERA